MNIHTIYSDMSIYKFDHHIQSTIFSKLRLNTEVRYKDLKIEGLESSQFVYHLQGLIRGGLVEKFDHGKYRLTAKGVELAQHFSSSKGALNIAPPTYTLIFLRSKKNKWAVLKRKKQPHFNKYACISGKVHAGETLADAAKRELNDFTLGTVTSPLSYIGYISVCVTTQGFQTHITGPIWFADRLEEKAFPDSRHGILEWHHWEKLPYDEFIPGWKEIIEYIEKGDRNYLDLHFAQP